MTDLILAMDRSERWKDQDGNLHVRVSNISKATVNPYRGNEIPGWEELGLDPERIYQLLRDPAELAKGAASFNNLRLLSKHVAVTAADPKEDLVAGSTGTDAAFDGTYLTNSLVIWRAEDIATIENGGKCELSCAYYYKPQMDPGTYQGLRYDGKMCDIVGNHVALVAAGRAGPDVAVHDSMETLMPSLSLSPQGLVAKGALLGYLRPKLKAGTVLALDAALVDVTAKTWGPKAKQALAARITALAKPMLAADASLEDMHGFLDRLDKEEESGAEDDDMSDDCEAMDAEEAEAENEERRKEREAKMSAADRKSARDARRGARDAARAARDSKSAKDKAKDAEPEEEEKKKAADKAKDKKAMDAAIDAAKADVREQLRAAAEAREEVRPFVGILSPAMDDASAIYKMALDAAKVDTSDVTPASYRAMVRMIPKPGARTAPLLANDAAPVEARFPNLARIGAA